MGRIIQEYPSWLVAAHMSAVSPCCHREGASNLCSTGGAFGLLPHLTSRVMPLTNMYSARLWCLCLALHRCTNFRVKSQIEFGPYQPSNLREASTSLHQFDTRSKTLCTQLTFPRLLEEAKLPSKDTTACICMVLHQKKPDRRQISTLSAV